MSATILPASRDPRAADLLRAAFRDVHGPRLHGFALLLTLGDRGLAGAAASRALAEGTARADALRHPERAAAWLRSRVVREIRRAGGSQPMSVEARDLALGELRMDSAAVQALAQLHLDERAVLIASAIERLDVADVATVLGSKLETTRRTLRAARGHYLAAAGRRLGEMPTTSLPDGALWQRVETEAAWAVGRSRGGGRA